MKTALIVDDSKIVRKVSARIMTSIGFEYTEAEDGSDAIVKVGEAMPEVILLDHHMPTMNGLDFLKELRKMPNGDKLVVIFCTSVNELDFIQSALMAGANEYVMKPFDEEIIADKLRQTGILPAEG